MRLLPLLLAEAAAYEGNFCLKFSGAQYVRVPHEVSMNAPLIDTWTVEAWVQFPRISESVAAERAVDAAERGEKRTLNVVGFPLRHPSLQVSRTGHAYTHVRGVGDQSGGQYSYEGTTYLFDGQWHHLAAVWDGGGDDEKDYTLALYVDGQLEPAGGPDDDESGEPKHPSRPSKLHPSGYVIASQCAEGLCDEGLHMGGFYQSGGKGYTGQFMQGNLDEVRIWKAPRSREAISSKRSVPLIPGDEPDLLFYFPFDEVGMESGSIVVESKAYPWFGILGNSKGHGRPARIESTAPISCLPGSKAAPCQPAIDASSPKAGLSPSLIASPSVDAPISRRSMSAAVLIALLLSALFASMVTRAVLLHGLDVSFSMSQLLQAPLAFGAMLHDMLRHKPVSGMPSVPKAGGYDTVA
ncbi:hypothetical protein AB1Y20_022121 [Prymnesium parvum]|uniref:LamG-like jellyroll fold domain-containing protein n=1 Tax=Prymnesium parvum TaxID=97485 RepID=A0AB34JEY6_PRYPA